ncbi:MAG TPA: Bcr/CflA family drug resistance efflux transporter, partial [Alphaproteobacteria bacterium]|nr:Bcr/CflA family drug resistance efflux transporter [Alphaproteobacteria bacterium]
MRKLTPDSRALVIVLALFTSIGALATDTYLPSLPAMEQVFSASTAEIQLTLSAFMLGLAVSQLFYGPMSDRFGRKPVMFGGLAIFVAASFACTIAQSVEMLIGLRFFQAVGASAGPVLARAIARDLHGGDKAARMLSAMGSVMGLVPAIAPIIGGYLEIWWGWHASFLFVGLIGIVAIAALVLKIAESLHSPDPEALQPLHLAKNFRSLLRDRIYLGYMACGCFSFAGLFAFISGSSFVLQGVFGVAAENFGLYFALVCLGYVAGTQIATRLTMRVGLARMVWFGALLAAASGIVMVGLALGGVDRPMAVVGPHIFFMASVGMVLPQSIAGALTPFPHMAGA